MSSIGSVFESDIPSVKIIYDKEILSSEEPLKEEWSSLDFELPETNVKRILYDQGLYDPGSREICTKYIPLSASSVLKHPYYTYPGIVDPGIKEALLHPEPKVKYPDDGKDLYISLCKESNTSPIKIFHSNLLQQNINLSYYGIHPMAFRPIALSLKYNRFVTILNLTDNWISLDGCFHLGEMLVDNITLKELNLYGCKIGWEGARRLFAYLHLNHSLKKLNLAKNQLKDAGLKFLAKAIFLGTDVAELILSKNELTANAIFILSEALETNNKLTHLDLSWNNILSANAIYKLCQRLSENNLMQELNLSWNSLSGPRVGNAIQILLNNPKIKHINLSNNKLSTPVVQPILNNLEKAISLNTLDLSYNPLTSRDALDLLHSLRGHKVTIKNLLLDNVIVTEEFIDLRNTILSFGFRKNTVVTHGYVQKKFIPKDVDMRELIFNRIENLCTNSKKKGTDFALIVQELYEIDKVPMDTKQFSREVKSRGAQLDQDLLGQLYTLFPGPILAKSVTVDLAGLIDYIERKWPNRKRPRTPQQHTTAAKK